MSQAAVTTTAPICPAFVNFNRNADGTVTVTARGEPKTRDGIYVCGGGSDRGQPGRCTPGDDACNNYCNMAPQKGPMADAPKATAVTREGPLSSLTLTADEFEQLIGQAVALAGWNPRYGLATEARADAVVAWFACLSDAQAFAGLAAAPGRPIVVLDLCEFVDLTDPANPVPLAR